MPPTKREPLFHHGRLLVCQLWHVFHVGNQLRCVVAQQAWPRGAPGTSPIWPRPLTGRTLSLAATPCMPLLRARCRLWPAVSVAAKMFPRLPPPSSHAIPPATPVPPACPLHTKAYRSNGKTGNNTKREQSHGYFTALLEGGRRERHGGAHRRLQG